MTRSRRDKPCQWDSTALFALKIRCLLSAIAALLAILAVPIPTWSTEQEITIESLLRSRWQVAGYSSTMDNRSTFILFRNPDETYLVQCQTGYDVTRSPRTFSHCYPIR